MAKRIEDSLQRALIQWIRAASSQSLVFHVPNGGRRGKVEAAILKGLGVTAGVPDLIILWPGTCAGLELKAKGGRPSPEQLAIGERFLALGHRWACVDDLDDAMCILRDWGLPLRGGQTS